MKLPQCQDKSPARNYSAAIRYRRQNSPHPTTSVLIVAPMKQGETGCCIDHPERYIENAASKSTKIPPRFGIGEFSLRYFNSLRLFGNLYLTATALDCYLDAPSLAVYWNVPVSRIQFRLR
jgi:hypothetical protein